MAKTLIAEPDISQREEAKKQRKKQARREARLMLEIELAKKDVQKAQKKLSKAQSHLDETQAHLHDLEAQLQQLRTPQTSQAQEVSTPQAQIDTEAIEAFRTTSIAPAEGRDDVAPRQETAQTQAEEQSAEQVINAQTSSTFEPAEGRVDLSSDQAPVTTSGEQPLNETPSDVFLSDKEASTPETLEVVGILAEESLDEEAPPLGTTQGGDITLPEDVVMEEGILVEESLDEEAPPLGVLSENDAMTPEDAAEAEDSTSPSDEEQQLFERGNEEPELSHNPIASSLQKNVPSQGEASNENKAEEGE